MSDSGAPSCPHGRSEAGREARDGADHDHDHDHDQLTDGSRMVS